MSHAKYPPYPAYKPSGVEWLGEVPEGWGVILLKYCTYINDSTLGETTDPDYLLQYIDIGNVDSMGKIHDIVEYRFEDAPSRARRMVKDGDVIISTVRTYLQAIAPIVNPPENLIVSTGFAVIRPERNYLDVSFCKYVLREAGFLNEVTARSVGVSYPAINASDLGNIPIPLPPLDEQRAIATFLDRETARIDILIAKMQRLLDLLAEKRQALITHAVTKGLDPHAPMKDSGVEWLGEVPQGWEVTNLSRNWNVKDCKHITAEYTDTGIPVISTTEVKPGRLSLETDRFTTEEYFNILTEGGRLPKKGDIIYSRNASLGSASYIDTDSKFCMGQDVCLITSPHYNQLFLMYQLNSTVLNQLGALVLGTTFKRINVDQIRKFTVTIPPKGEQIFIAQFLDRQTTHLDRLCQRIEEAIARLQERRVALITATVTGQIDIRSEVHAG